MLVRYCRLDLISCSYPPADCGGTNGKFSVPLELDTYTSQHGSTYLMQMKQR